MSWAVFRSVLPMCQGGHPSTLLDTGEAMPAVLCPVLGYSVQERKFGARAVKMEYFILRKDEKAGAVQSGEGEAQGSHHLYFMGRN